MINDMKLAKTEKELVRKGFALSGRVINCQREWLATKDGITIKYATYWNVNESNCIDYREIDEFYELRKQNLKDNEEFEKMMEA